MTRNDPSALTPAEGRIGLREDDTLDEVFVHEPKAVHLEQMSDGAWWMRIDLRDGRGVVVNLWTKRARITASVEVEPA